MTIWLTLISIGIITFAIRLSFIMFFGKVEIPPMLLRMLRFVPVTVLSAIILPQLFLPGQHFDISLDNPRWIAGLLAVIVAWRTHNVLVTIVVGMLALWALQLLLR